MSYLEGFAVIPRALQRDPDVSGKAKLVYITLSSRANARMECRPSHETMADESSMSVASVKRALEELRELGYVSWYQQIDPAKQTRGSNVYRLYPDASGAAAHTEPRTSRSSKPQLKAAAHTELQTIQGNDSREREQEDIPSAGAREEPQPITQPLAVVDIPLLEIPEEPTFRYDKPVPLPADFHLTTAMKQICRDKGWSQEFVAWSTERMADWARSGSSANTKSKDWIAKWRNWLSREEIDWRRLQRQREIDARNSQHAANGEARHLSTVDRMLADAAKLKAEEDAQNSTPNGGYNLAGRELNR